MTRLNKGHRIPHLSYWLKTNIPDNKVSRDSSIGIVTGLQAGSSGF